MIWAIKNEIKTKAIPKEKALCPICKEEVISKCGKIKIWHWAHKSNKDCDNWYEPESEWHLNWKNEFPKECQEFTMGKHRADIRTKSRWIIELQNSSISSEEIKEREKYYKRMIWLLNGKTIAKNIDLRKKKEKDYVTFRWKHPPKCWWEARKQIFIDFGKWYFIAELKKIYHNTPCGGWGELITKEDFLKKFE